MRGFAPASPVQDRKRRKSRVPWTQGEIDAYDEGIKLHGSGSWKKISESMTEKGFTRTNLQCHDYERTYKLKAK